MFLPKTEVTYSPCPYATVLFFKLNCNGLSGLGRSSSGEPALFTKAKKVIKKVADFIIEAGFFESFKFGADCFLFTTNTRLPLQLARHHSTPVLLTMGLVDT